MIAEEIQIAVYAFLNSLSLYTLDGFLVLFLDRRNLKMRVKFIPYLIYFIVGIFTYYLSNIPSLNSLISIVLVLIITLNYNGKIKSRVALSFFWTLFRFIIELAVSMVYVNILNITLNQMIHNDLLKILGNAYIAIISLVIVKVFPLILRRKTQIEKITYIESFKISIIPICSIVILYAFMKISLDYNLTNWIVVVSIVLIVFINIFFFYLFDRLKDIEKLKFENELLKNQSEYYVKLEESMNSSFDRVRTIKHDLKHQLLYLRAKTQEKTAEAFEEVERTLERLIGDTLSEDLIEYTKNIKLNRLINYKLLYIHKHEIEVELIVNVSENSRIDENSLYIILGNAIDNAVENFDMGKKSYEKIVIMLVEESKNLFIKVSNPYKNKLTFRNGLPITSKIDKSMHSIGLKSIKNLVEDNNGYFKIKTKDNIFSLEILLFDKIK